MAMTIVISCAAALVISTAFLLYAGMFGRRGILWTARMSDNERN